MATPWWWWNTGGGTEPAVSSLRLFRRLTFQCMVGALVCGAGQVAWAQENPDSTSVVPTVAPAPVAGFDSTSFNPFFIQNPTGTFRLSIGAYAQVRYEINARNDVPDSVRAVETGPSLNRARFFFQGRYSDDFDFRLALNVPSGGEIDLQQAYFTYFFGDVWQLWVGEQFFNSMREDWPDPTQTSSMDNSAVDYTFALGTAFGAFIHRAPVDKTRWWLAISNGAYGSKRQFAEFQESDVMVFGRLDYQPVGDDWWVWDDLIGGPGYPFAVLLGFSPGFMVIDDPTPGRSRTTAQMNADVSVNGDGYQVVLAGVWTGHFPKEGPSYNNYGVYFQAGYFFQPRWQGYVRYDFVSPGNQPGDFEAYSAPGIGVSFFPLSMRRWRFTAELNYLFGALNRTIVGPAPELGWLPSDSRGQTNLRLQAQFGF